MKHVRPEAENLFTNRQEYIKQIKNCEIGDYTYGTPRIWHYDDRTPLVIGRFCSIAAEVCILKGGEHRADFGSTYPFPYFFQRRQPPPVASKGPIVIGSDVWLGFGCTILTGVTIGHGAVVGAGSVVSKDIEPYAIVAGNPARVIRHRFEPATVELMLRLAWWDWDIDDILENLDLIMDADPEALRRFLDQREKARD